MSPVTHLGLMKHRFSHVGDSNANGSDESSGNGEETKRPSKRDRRNTRILVVDDEDIIRKLLVRALTKWGYSVTESDNADVAIQIAKRENFHLALLDLNMPGHDGMWLIDKLQALEEPPMVIMVTGQSDIHVAIHCLTHGAFDFMLKPVDLEYLRNKVESALMFLHLKREEKKFQELLEEVAISERWKGQQMFLNSIDALIRALEAKDDYTEGHSSRVALLTEGIAGAAKMRSHEVNDLVTAARCHDIGKIGVKDAVLLKPGKLTFEEFTQIKVHPSEGGRILAPIFKDFPKIIEAVRHHHERWDGGGYPDGLAGEEIPFGARIIATADAYDAMTSTRVYRSAKSAKEAVEEIIAGIGKQFCPVAAKAFLDFYKKHMCRNQEEDWQDRRKEPRFYHSAQAIVHFENQPLMGEILEVSHTGARIRLHSDIPASSIVSLQLEDQPPMDAYIHWARQLKEGAGGMVELGASLREPHGRYRAFVDGIMFSQMDFREQKRINRVVPVSVLSPNDEEVLGREASNCSILNLSAEGAFIQTRNPKPVGTEFIVRFTLPDRELTPFEALGRVTHFISMVEALQSEGSIPGMGVHFIEYSGESREKLHRYIDTHLVENRLKYTGKDSDDGNDAA